MSKLPLLILLFAWFSSAFAQTTNVTQADGIRASDGTCLTASTTTDSSGVTLEKCDRDQGQQWTLSTSGPHIRDQGFAIIILAGTDACLDSAAINNSLPGLYSCGGLPGGVGNESLNQAFSYSTLKNSTGPLVFIPLVGWNNNGVGPGQSCLSASQGKLDLVPCDPASPSPEQQFYLGFNTNTTPSATSSAASATASQSSAKRRSSVIPVAIAVPIAVIILLLLGFILVRQYLKAREKHKDQTFDVRAARPFIAEPSSTTTSSMPFTQTSGGMKRELASITTSAVTSPLPVISSGLASSSTGGYTFSPQTTDIDQIVSLAAARIDGPGPQHAQTVDSMGQALQPGPDSASDRPSLSTDVPPSIRTATTIASPSPPQHATNVNIDTILTLLAARVDPSYREQTDTMDTRDAPPSYRIPPSYHE